MKLLLTGARGFTGRHFGAAASAAGFEVVRLDCDLTLREKVAAEIARKKPDMVVHLAAKSFVGHANEAEFYAVNVLGTTNLLDALSALETGPELVLLASSANVYGDSDTSPIPETQSAAPVNHYAMSKLAMEYMARTYMKRLPVIIARPFNYTGPGQATKFLIPKLVDHFARRSDDIELGNLGVEREFNDVRMVCNAYLALLRHGQPGEVYNVCTGRMYSLQNVIDILSGMTGHSPKIKVNPAYVRKNEVRQLCGDPSKLKEICKKDGLDLDGYDLKQTLAWMLSEVLT